MSEPDDQDELGGLIEASARSATFSWGAPQAPEREQELLPVLHFLAGDRHYAMAGELVREVVGEVRVTPLPGAPPHLAGIIIHRRQVVGVIDLDRWFGTSTPSRPPGRVILMEYQGALVGLNASEVTQIEQWPLDALNDSIDALPAPVRRYALGARGRGDQVVALLDIKRLLEDAAVRG